MNQDLLNLFSAAMAYRMVIDSNEIPQTLNPVNIGLLIKAENLMKQFKDSLSEDDLATLGQDVASLLGLSNDQS